MTHEESRQRRLKWALAVAAGATPADVAGQHRVDPSAVREACHEHDVTWKKEYRGDKIHPFAVLAELRAAKSLRAAGTRCGISYEWVRQIKLKAIEYGVL